MQLERAGGSSQRRDLTMVHGERVERPSSRREVDAPRTRTAASDGPSAADDRATSTSPSSTAPSSDVPSKTASRPRPTLQSSLESRARFGRETGATDLAYRLQARFDQAGAAPLRTDAPLDVRRVPSTAGATAARTSAGTAGATRVQQVGDPGYQEALENQRALSQARQDLGNAQLELENRNILQKGWDFVTGGDDEKEQHVDALKQRVAELEADEAKLPKDAVAQARLTVFDERLRALEQSKGKGEAARLARQTYYDSDVWNGAAGTGKASEAEINAAGFPHGEWHSGAATDGYDGEMQTRDGNVVDMGHVACALDWQVNGRGGFPNPFDANAVTLTGDLASAILNTPSGGDAPAAIDREGDADWNGDLDGNNLAKRLADHPEVSLADTVSSYYEAGDYAGRIDEWATHSKYVERGDDDVPLRDSSGHYVLDLDQLQRDANGFAVILSKGGTLNPLSHFEDRAVIEAWKAWFDGQPQTLR